MVFCLPSSAPPVAHRVKFHESWPMP